MTVVPRKCGQELIKKCLDKIVFLKSLKQKNNYKFEIEVDGGIKLENIGPIKNLGADIFVSGSGIFNYENFNVIIEKMKKIVL